MRKGSVHSQETKDKIAQANSGRQHTQEELSEIQKDLAEFKCSNCGSLYKQWKRLPNWETCPVCEILIDPPKCPNCTDKGSWIEDLALYHCMFCGQWFKAPYSIHSRRVKHHHYWRVILENATGVTKGCIACGKQIILSQNDIKNNINRYKNAPAQFTRLQRRNQETGRRLQGEEKVNAWLESLTSEELRDLKGGTITYDANFT